MQPYLFPYLGYFQLLKAVDKFVYLDDVNFIKKGWINRNRILINGEIHYFTVPLKNLSQNEKICNLQIDNNSKIFSKLMNTFSQAYARAVNKKTGLEVLEEVLQRSSGNIGDLSKSSVQVVLSYLGIEKEIVFSSKVYNNSELRGQDRILDICRIESAGEYVNLPGGRLIYNQNDFAQRGMTISFVESFFPVYPQLSDTFVSGLSILDALMNCKKEQINEAIDSYRLIH